MAVYNLPNYVNEQGFGLPLNIRRGNPNPLDNSSVWQSFAAAQNYAQNDPTAYVGQIISVVNYVPAVTDEEGTITTPSQSTVEVYYIKDEAGALEPVGTSPVGDEGTITVAEDGTVSLYGIAGLELTREDENGETVNITYQPLYVNGKLTWVEPSATTVEGLAAEIEGLKTRISALETAVGDAEGGLVKDVADHGEAIEAINAKIGDVEDGKTVVQMIADSVYDDTDMSDRVKAVEDEIGKASEGEAAATGLHARLEDLEGLIGEESVSEQIAKETERATKAEKVLSDAIGAASTTDAEGQPVAATGLHARLEAIEGDYLTSADKQGLQTQIDTIMNNPDTEGVINSINEFTGYIASHGEIAEGFRADINALKGVVGSEASGDAAATGLVKDVADNAAAIEAINDKIGTVDEGKTVVEMIAAAQEEATYDDTALAQRVTDVEAEIGVASAEGVAATGLHERIEALESLVGEDKVSEQIESGIANKVDKVENARLMTNAEGDKLEGIAEGAQVNVIDTVDEAQFGLENKHLTLLDIAMGKVTGLSDALAGKVDKVDGSRLLTEDEATKLEKLVLGENGEVSVSGKVAAGNVEGLDAWITARAGNLKGLSENNLTDTLLGKLNGIAEGAQVNVIDTVSDEFTVNGKNLAVNAIAQSKITGLVDALKDKVDAMDGYRLISETELERIAKIESGAQVNKIEGVKLGDTLLEIVDKVVTIPAYAGLKASNEITIAEDGALGVGAINVNKLVQGENEFLILNGGAAAQ